LIAPTLLMLAGSVAAAEARAAQDPIALARAGAAAIEARRFGDALEPLCSTAANKFGDITRLAAWSAAAYDGRIRVPLGGPLEQHDELDRVLSHEFVHAVVGMVGAELCPDG
jgi:hypothetical protein